MPLLPDEKHILQLADKLRPLTALEGWKIYLSILDGHISSKTALALRPAESIEGVVRSEADKGAIMGLRLARGIVGSILEDAESIRKKYTSADVDLTGDD